jgi:outer membrane protein, heavy metal efflux system
MVVFTVVQAQQAVALTVPTALERARVASPTLRVAQAQLTDALAKVRGASASPLPMLSIAHGVGNGTGGLDEDILLSVPLELRSKREPRVAAARAEALAALARRDTVERELSLTVRLAYTESLQAAAEVALARQQAALTQTLVTAAEQQFQAGDAPRSNVERGKIERAKAEQALQLALTESENRLTTLRSLTGTAPGTPLTLSDTLPISAPERTLAALLARAKTLRPERREALALETARTADLQTAKSTRQPDVFVETRRSNWTPLWGASSIRAGVTFPLFDSGRIASGVQSAQAAQSQQLAQSAEVERTIALEVETSWRSYDQARRTLLTFTAERLERARTVQELATLGYERGANSYLELLDAQQAARSEQLEFVRAQAALARAQATLERAVGGKLE